MEGSSKDADVEMTLEEEEALYYAEAKYDHEDKDATYGGLLADYEGNYEFNDEQYVKVLGLINQTNKIFTDAAFNLDLSLNLRHDLVVQVYENSLLYNYMYNRMICSSINKSDIIRTKYNAFPTYNVGNMNKYVTCKGKIKKQDCPCPKCVESYWRNTMDV